MSMDNDQEELNEILESETEELIPEGSAEDEETTNEETETVEETDEESVSLVKVEIDGQEYEVPEAIQASILQNQDYQTQLNEVIETREALATQRLTLQADAEFNNSNLQLVSQMQSIDAQLAEIHNVDWNTFRQNDPDGAQNLLFYSQQLQGQKTQLANQLNMVRSEYQTNREKIMNENAVKAETVLKRDIKDWSPAKSAELSQFAISKFGFSAADLDAAKTDPRIVKLIDAAFMGQKLSQVKNVKPKVPNNVRPITKVKGKAVSTTKQTDDMDINEWMALENKKKQR